MTRFSLTILGLFILSFPAAAQTDDVKGTIAYVHKLQTNTGGFLSQAPQSNIRLAPNLRATSAAVRALYYLGAPVPNKEACRKFVASCYHPESGGFANIPGGEPDVFTTGVGIMAVARLDMPMEKYTPGVSGYLNKNSKSFEDIRIAVAGFETIKSLPENAKVWLEEVEKLRNADGSYGKEPALARDTGSAVVALLRLGGKVQNTEKIVKVLKDGQRPNGGYGKEANQFTADLETTYRVMRAFLMLKEKPADAEGVRSFVLKCRNEDHGYSNSPGEPSTVGATYFAIIIRHWLKD